MKYIRESFKHLFGGAATRPQPDEITPAAQRVHFYKKQQKVTKEEMIAIHAAHEGQPKRWRTRRWITLLVVNLLFVVSFYFDIQLLEGAMTASRFIGFHMADLNSALHVMLAFKELVLNLVIGTVTIFILWLLLGGRTFCSWACPYHLLSEWAEMIHLWLVRKKIIKNHTFDRRARTVLYVIFACLSIVTGYTVFETISPTGIVSRALIYGPGIALIWIAFLLLVEVFYSRRAWCRYACPIGITYGAVGAISPLRVKFNAKDCHHEGDCRKACLVPHVLDMTIKGRAQDVDMDLSADCTRCGMCIDICPTDSLKFEFKGLGKHL
ncbi:MAG: NapH/MauN family ferredoxin-type protein [Candidatus Sedimenticola sp. (ex Thyasira tokunagai)]